MSSPFLVDVKRYLLHLIATDIVTGLPFGGGFPKSLMMQLLPWSNLQADFIEAMRGKTCGVGEATDTDPDGECVYYMDNVVDWLQSDETEQVSPYVKSLSKLKDM